MAPFPMAKSDVISQLHVEKFPIAFGNHFFKAIKKSKTSQQERTLNLKITANLKEIVSLFFILKLCNFSQIPQNDHNLPNS